MELRTERDRVAHLLRRFGLGASEAEVDYYSKGGLSGAIDSLINYEQIDEGFDVPLDIFKAGKQNRVNVIGVQAWWVFRLLATRRPFQEKMTLFWHNHFATSAAKVAAPLLMYQQNETLRQYASARFQDLLLNVSKDPAMLLWLDNEYNVKGKANENFAREVMELFTLGIGHYSEKDIQESARAFTGWGLRRLRKDDETLGKDRAAIFFFRENLHDDGEKSFMGNRGNFNGDDIIGILCGNPQTAHFLTKKMWTWFGYPDPEPELIDRLAKDWYSHGLDVKYLARKMMESEELYSDRAARAVYKNPVDFVIAPMRQLGIGPQLVAAVKGAETIDGQSRAVIGAAQQALKAQGMTLLFPPDVSGWSPGQAWVTSATMVERIEFGNMLYGTNPPGARRAQINYTAYALFQNNPSPVQAVRKLLSLYDVELPEAKVHFLAQKAMDFAQGSINEDNANLVASQVSRLIFGCPEYQFC